MRQVFGHRSVTFVAVGENPAVRDRYNKPQETRTEIVVKGCHFRPLTAQERINLGDIAREQWKLTAPPVAAVVNATAIGEVKVDGVSYEIVGGVRVHHDFSKPLKVTVICERIIS